jgi:hypothetical protein
LDERNRELSGFILMKENLRQSISTAAVLIVACALASHAIQVRAQNPVIPTFSKDVAPILYGSCVSCHRPGEMAPMSLVTYAQVRPYASSIRARIESGAMPPWHAEAPAGTFRNERLLTPAQKQTLVQWASNGAPEGNPQDLPVLPAFPTGWTIGTPDAIVSMAQTFEVPASGEVEYKYFQAPTNFTEDKWVQAVEIRPGARRAVHHVLVFASEPGNQPRQQPFTAGALRDRLQNAGAARGPLIATTAPGTNAQVYQPGNALRIKAGSVLTLQVHYTATGKPEKDQTAVGFIFANQPPKQEVRAASFVNAQLVIPAGAENHRVDSTIEFTQDAHIVALFPHTHLRGKSWEYRLTYPDGRQEIVLKVPRYDFNWQTYYEYARPIAAPKGSRLLAIAHYDNSANNKANPDPTKAVRWGDQTWEEMQYSGITYTVD